MRQIPVLILFGRPGSGKGTVAQMLAEAGWAHCSTGQAMREWAEGPSAEQRELKAALARGEFGSDELAARIVGEFVAALPAGTPGVVLDGFPRTLAQLDAWLALDIAATAWIIDLPRSTAQARMRVRGTCAADGYSTAVEGMACPMCGRLTTRRADDGSAATRNERERLFGERGLPIIDRWLGAGLPARRLSNSGSLAELRRQVTAALADLSREPVPSH